jgi:protein phosphatase methylesterase 1
MQCFLSSRPKQFSTQQQAIEYMVRSGQVRNIESARVSIIGQIQSMVTTQSNETDSSTIPAVSHLCEPVREEDEDEEEDVEDKPSVNIQQSPPPPPPTNMSNDPNKYTWRIDLSKTEQFWQGWFSGLLNSFLDYENIIFIFFFIGLSKLFLSCECPKLLLLAGVDRLDRDLTVGQMQGKFQMHVVPKSGHAVHEDAPEQVADCIASFLVRHKLVQPIDENFQGTLPGC